MIVDCYMVLVVCIFVLMLLTILCYIYTRARCRSQCHLSLEYRTPYYKEESKLYHLPEVLCAQKI
jgi:hypothetical protein